MSEALTRKYRPGAFVDVTGQHEACRAMSRAIEKNQSQAYFLTGPSGTGKTTLARIGALYFGCDDTPDSILEVDGATYTGIDKVRELQDAIRYKPFGTSSSRAVIMDECHRLSGQAWDALLKVLEEPPTHVMFFLCTTNPAKVPKTIQTRCTPIVLNPVSKKDLSALLDKVIAAEKIKLASGVFDLIVNAADGSPRQSLSMLTAVMDAKDKASASKMLLTVDENSDDPVIQLCRLIVSGGKWETAMGIVGQLEVPAESARIVICAYLSKVAMGAKSNDKAGASLEKLDAFATPYPPTDGMAPLLISLGRVLL